MTSLVPTAAANKLTAAFGKLGTKATGAKNGLNTLKDKWNEAGFADRGTVVDSLESAASNIGAFANAGEDPVGAIQAGLNMIAQFAKLAGPHGQIVSVVLSFISGFLSLFGLGGEQKSVGEIVREQIDEALDLYYSNDLKNLAAGTISTLQTSKSYVDYLAQRGESLTVAQAQSVQTNVPLWLGLEFMGTLSGEIGGLLHANKKDDAKKILVYIELYSKMAILKDIILQETAALFPDELAINREAMLKTQQNLRNVHKKMFKFLYESDVGKIAIPYFDPDNYPITDAYLSVVLKAPNYDRSLAGIWCLTPAIRGDALLPLTFESTKHSSLQIDGNAYITTGRSYCFWKLVPHGKNLFSIVNYFFQVFAKKNPGLIPPGFQPPASYLSLGISSGQNTRAISKSEPMLWEIRGRYQKRCVFILSFHVRSVRKFLFSQHS